MWGAVAGKCGGRICTELQARVILSDPSVSSPCGESVMMLRALLPFLLIAFLLASSCNTRDEHLDMQRVSAVRELQNIEAERALIAARAEAESAKCIERTLLFEKEAIEAIATCGKAAPSSPDDSASQKRMLEDRKIAIQALRELGLGDCVFAGLSDALQYESSVAIYLSFKSIDSYLPIDSKERARANTVPSHPLSPLVTCSRPPQATRCQFRW
jgi:hypothetical protein